MKQLLWGVVVFLLLGCSGRQGGETTDYGLCDTDFVTVRRERVRYTSTEQRLLSSGLVDVQTLDPTIRVHLVYATADNFLGRVLYTDIHRAFLLPMMAKKVAGAQ